MVDSEEAAVAVGMEMGPVELADSVGLDVALHVSKVLGEGMGRSAPAALQKMVDDGHLGRKSGQGYYRWENGKVVKPDSPTRHDSDEISSTMQDRLLLLIVNATNA